jgi:hypothetical protein
VSEGWDDAELSVELDEDDDEDELDLDDEVDAEEWIGDDE